jgi:hypothetical protein
MEKLMSDIITTIDSQAARLISKSTPRKCHKLISMVDEHYMAHNLYNHLSKLTQISIEQWSNDHQAEYEECDKQHIIGLTAAEKKACKTKPFPWSPAF